MYNIETDTVRNYLDLAESIAVILVSIVGVYGYINWRRDYKNRRKMELFEELFISIQKVKDCFYEARQLTYNRDIAETRKKNVKESSELSTYLDLAHISLESYNKYQNVFDRIGLYKEFDFLLGNEIAAQLNQLILLRNDFVYNIHSYSRYMRIIESSRNKQIDFSRWEKKIEKSAKVIWASYEDDDNFGTEIEKVCRKLELLLVKKLK